MMLLISVNFLILILGAFCFIPRFAGTIINSCMSCCHTAAIAVALAKAFNPSGARCGWNTSPAEYEGELIFKEGGFTYSDEYSMLFYFTII